MPAADISFAPLLLGPGLSTRHPVMRSKAFRNIVGLPPVTPPAPLPAGKQESFTEMYNRYLRQAEEMQKQASREAGEQAPGAKAGPKVKTFAVKQQGRKRRGNK